MITDRDLRQQIDRTIAAAGPDIADQINVDTLTEEIHRTYGLVDIDTIDPETFWAIAARHDTTPA